MHPLRFGLKLSQNATIDTLTHDLAASPTTPASTTAGTWTTSPASAATTPSTSSRPGPSWRAWPRAPPARGWAARSPATPTGTRRCWRRPPSPWTTCPADGWSSASARGGRRTSTRCSGSPFGTARDRADWLEEALPIIRSLWTEPRTTFTGKHYLLTEAVAEPKPVQTPHPPIWIGGVGRRRTLRMAAEHAAVWNAPGGSPAEVAELSAVLDGHCADIGRDPAEIRRSVQIRVPADAAALVDAGRGLRRGRGHRDHPDRGGRAGRAGRAGGGAAARAARASVRVGSSGPVSVDPDGRRQGAGPSLVPGDCGRTGNAAGGRPGRRDRWRASDSGRRVRARSPTTQAAGCRAARRPAGRGTSSSLR